MVMYYFSNNIKQMTKYLAMIILSPLIWWLATVLFWNIKPVRTWESYLVAAIVGIFFLLAAWRVFLFTL